MTVFEAFALGMLAGGLIIGVALTMIMHLINKEYQVAIDSHKNYEKQLLQSIDTREEIIEMYHGKWLDILTKNYEESKKPEIKFVKDNNAWE